MIFAHIENSCLEDVDFKLVDGLPQTTKKNKKEHGFGLRSIRLICEEFGGGLDFRKERDRFYLDIVIPIPKTKEESK